MGLEDRYQLLAVRKIVGKHQMSIIPVSEVFSFILLPRMVFLQEFGSENCDRTM